MWLAAACAAACAARNPIRMVFADPRCVDFDNQACHEAGPHRPIKPSGRRNRMPQYLTQVSYTQEAWQALVNNPQDRIEAVRPAIEKLGGRVVNAWFAFGDYDVVAVLEMPNNVAAAAIAIAFAAGGACRSVKTTPLLSTAEAVEAAKKA